MTRSLASVANEVHGRLIGADSEFDAVTTDSRQAVSGALFVAISGERFDGNDFVADVHEKGAAGALVSRVAESPLPQVEVDDTRRALGAMARAWRGNFPLPVVAVTGSAGKTTVKELIAAILRVNRKVCVTQGNLNNDIGLPLTLMRISPEHEVLVVELGANHAGEIDNLSRLAQPTIGVITNAGAAHLEGFGSLAGVAAAKGELLDHLPRTGTSVLNADDPFRADWRARTRTWHVITFGFSADADCRVLGEPELRGEGSRFTMRLPDGEPLDIELPLVGRQNVANALAAAAAAHAAGARSAEIRAGLARGSTVRGRMTVLRGSGGATVVDDSYNANPASALAALDWLGERAGKRVFVLGDMAELGAEAEALHRETGVYARRHCDALIAIGSLAAHAADAFGTTGEAFADIESARRALEPRLAGDLTILIKGSRVMRLDRLVAAFVDPDIRRPDRC
ncbi:UDP-N-acetylmuramoyl-tripeptide--D-alanyl-D-alanine ligase [Candidatus Rariloculus sp.]|uniref:UDP-N-acetylmuramoyl-tripeptide--D-alanyl-D- alanine ligase n=1 Tax=Candidatus Rariloculus sp. TaxID=3101265 RepID=UPI003D10811E